MKKTMKIIVIIAAVAVGVAALFGALSSSGNEKYKMEYDSKDLYRGAKDSYKAGQKVTLRFPYVASDTSYRFYLSGKAIDATYSDLGGYKLEFVMPPYDAKLECVTKNDMMYTPPEEGIKETLLYEYYSSTSAVADGHPETYTIALYYISETDAEGNQEDRTELRVTEVKSDGTKTENVYDARLYGSYECDLIADEYHMHGWDTMRNTISEDGLLVAVKFKTGTGYIRVSNECMPENGREGMGKIRMILEGYMTE